MVGPGPGHEGALVALGFGFTEHRLERIIGVTAPWNMAARRVMEKAGLIYQGTRPYRSLEPEPVWYAIDRVTWEARAGAGIR